MSLCREMTRPEKLAACAALLTQFAEACRKGDKAQVMLLHDSLFSETNQVGSRLLQRGRPAALQSARVYEANQLVTHISCPPASFSAPSSWPPLPAGDPGKRPATSAWSAVASQVTGG